MQTLRQALHTPTTRSTLWEGKDKMLQRAELAPGNTLNYVLGLSYRESYTPFNQPLHFVSRLQQDSSNMTTLAHSCPSIHVHTRAHAHRNTQYSLLQLQWRIAGSAENLSFFQISKNFPLATCCSRLQNHCNTKEGYQVIAITRFFQITGSHLFKGPHGTYETDSSYVGLF